jgi:hypothetical protein
MSLGVFMILLSSLASLFIVSGILEVEISPDFLEACILPLSTAFEFEFSN